MTTKKSKPKDHKLAAKLYLREGRSLRESLTTAGYSEAQARKSIADLRAKSRPLRKAWEAELKRLGKYMETFKEAARNGLWSPADRAKAIRYRLQMNVAAGEDGGHASAKLAGSDKELNLWEPDMAIGILSMTPPEEWRDRYSLSSNEPVNAKCEICAKFKLCLIDSMRWFCLDCRPMSSEPELPLGETAALGTGGTSVAESFGRPLSLEEEAEARREKWAESPEVTETKRIAVLPEETREMMKPPEPEKKP